MAGINEAWPARLQLAQVRIARPTDKLQEVERFYCEGIGLQKLGYFKRHNGYDGIMLELPGYTYHLEFTQHIAGSSCPAPSKDNLLVFYIPDQESINNIVQRMHNLSYFEVPPENPYWATKEAITIEDPDGWRIVLIPTAGIN